MSWIRDLQWAHLNKHLQTVCEGIQILSHDDITLRGRYHLLPYNKSFKMGIATKAGTRQVYETLSYMFLDPFTFWCISSRLRGNPSTLGPPVNNSILCISVPRRVKLSYLLWNNVFHISSLKGKWLHIYYCLHLGLPLSFPWDKANNPYSVPSNASNFPRLL